MELEDLVGKTIQMKQVAFHAKKVITGLVSCCRGSFTCSRCQNMFGTRCGKKLEFGIVQVSVQTLNNDTYSQIYEDGCCVCFGKPECATLILEKIDDQNAGELFGHDLSNYPEEFRFGIVYRKLVNIVASRLTKSRADFLDMRDKLMYNFSSPTAKNIEQLANTGNIRKALAGFKVMK